MKYSLNGIENSSYVRRFIKYAKSSFRNNLFCLWVIQNKEDNKVIGYCGNVLQSINGIIEVELGYRLLPEYWGKGFAFEAALLVKSFAFNELLIPRVISIIDKENYRSIKLAKKIGMTLESEAIYNNKFQLLYSAESLKFK